MSYRLFPHGENIASKISCKCTSESCLTYHAAVAIPHFVLGNIQASVSIEARRRRRGYAVNRMLQRGSEGVLVVLAPVFRGFDEVATHGRLHVTGLEIVRNIEIAMHHDPHEISFCRN